MREIKFRGWDSERKEMLGPQDLSQSILYWSWLGTRDVVLMQYTGFKDKNGKEIYEGDIIAGANGSINLCSWSFKPREIKWDSERAEFTVPMWGTEGRTDSTHWIEVVGNIYENPELLDRKQ